MKVEKIYLAIRKRVLKALRGKYFVAERRGARFLIDIDDHVSRQIEAYGIYERDQIEQLLGMAAGLDKPELFLDVGANLGLYSIEFSRRTGLPVIAFEPDTRCRYHLNANIFLNNLEDRIRVEPLAVSSGEGVVRFARYADQNRGRSRVSEDGESEVRAVTLDAHLPLEGKDVVIKVDIEGHEKEFIRGARTFLTKNNCVLQVEILQAREEAIGLLAELGYEQVGRLSSDFYFRKRSGRA